MTPPVPDPNTPSAKSPTGKPDSSRIDVKKLKQSHPRVLLTEDKLGELRGKVRDDELFQELYRAFYAEAVKVLNRQPVTYKKDGRRLNAVCQRCAGRVILLGLTYLLSDEPRFLKRAEQEMLAGAAFPDWNPSHYLDTGEMTAALGIGIDWLFNDLNPDSREIIAEAIDTKGLRTLYLEDGSERPVMFSNWIQVCLGGLAIGALAIAERDPAFAEKIINIAVDRSSDLVRAWYTPEGAYAEGPTYWDYGTSYHVLLMAGVISAFGSDFGMGSVPGLKESSLYRVAACAPSGRLYNYSDSDEYGDTHPIQFWFASHFDQMGVVSEEDLRKTIQTYDPDNLNSRFAPLALIWLNRETLGGSLPDQMLNFTSGGKIPVGMFRSAWNDPAALFLGTVAGKGNVPHGHLDAGSWLLEWDGVRWAMDLGRVDYHEFESRKINIWDTRPEGARWTVFHFANFGHNTLTANDALHDAKGESIITEFTAIPGFRNVSLDLTPCFPDTMEKVTRRFSIKGDDEITIEDDWTGTAALKKLTWRMFTSTRIDLDRGKAHLFADGKRLLMEILHPVGTVFTARPAAEMLAEHDVALPGIQALEIDLKESRGNLVIRISAPVAE
ncbi:MAG: heparinase II/III family protein [Chthoniobacterales bacterium]